MVYLHKDLFDILLGYFALVPPRILSFPLHLPFNVIHNFFVESVLLGNNLPHPKAYLPSNAYQYTFWKWAIQHLEDMSTNEDTQIDDRIFIHFISLFPPASVGLEGLSAPCPPPQSYVTQYWKFEKSVDNGQTIVDTANYHSTTLLESRTTIESGTTGLRTWLASQVLAQYLILYPDLVNNKRILELGSGAGLLGIIVATLQQLHHAQNEVIPTPVPIWLTDVNDAVLSRCRDNVQLPCNSSSSHLGINYCLLDWSDALETPEALPLRSVLHDEIKPDLVLGADLVFDPDLIPALVGTLRIAMQHGAEALIALTVRNEDTFSKFIHAAEQSLSLLDLDVHLDNTMFFGMLKGHLDGEMDVKIFKLSRKEQQHDL